MASYDILIKGGLVVDGSGTEPALADVGVSEGKIEAVGALGAASAKTVINANQKYVTPGFIDLTNHSDTFLTLFSHPAQESLLMQGITTVLGGNCGASLAPLASKTAIKAISKWADPSAINIDWNSTGEFLEAMARLRPGVNFATLAGYGTLRRGIIGDEVRALSLEEREKIKYLLVESVREGAFGLSMGLAYGHERASPAEEVIDIAKSLYGTDAMVKIHLRSEGSDIVASVNEAVRIGRETGLAVSVSHFKGIGKKSWDAVPTALELMERAEDSGVNISFDVSPYATTNSPLYALIPGWAREGGFRTLFAMLADADSRRRVTEALKTHTLHYDRILVTSAKIKSIVGKTIAEIAERAGLPPEEALVETVQANEGRVFIIGRTVSQKNVFDAMMHPLAAISTDGAGYSSDSTKSGNLVHPRSFGALPHFWHMAVQDKKLLKPEEAVRKISSLPASTIGLRDRGLLKKGFAADVAVFDPRLFRDRATYRNPYRYPAGMEWVIVNGVVVVEQGKVLGARAGEILRKI